MRTTRNEEFVSLHEDDITIFTTAENLNMLRRSHHWFCDGTFDSAPHDHQLFTIHVLLEDTHTVPLVYCITRNKNEDTYRRILEHLKEKQSDLDPISLTEDFEAASIHAMRAAFPDIEIAGCYFHFAQATYKKLQSLG